MSGVLSILPRPLFNLGVQGETSYSRCLDPDRRKVAIRLAVVALEFFLYFQAGLSFSQTALIGTALSVPSSLMAGGFSLFYLVSQVAFENIGLAFCYLVGGYLLFENYDVIEWGVLERFIPSYTTSVSFDEGSKEDWVGSNTYSPSRSQKERLEEFEDLIKEIKVVNEDNSPSIPERDVFSYRDVLTRLGTEDVVEFYYSASEIEDDPDAKKRGLSITGKGKQQVHYASFSSTYPGEFEIDGKKWKSREHYVLAQMYEEGSPTYEAIYAGMGSLGDSRTLAQTLQSSDYIQDLRLDTDEKWKRWHEFEAYQFRLNANKAYFGQYKEQKYLLLSTENLPLIERSPQPTRWGITTEGNFETTLSKNGEWINRNAQGWILMQLRFIFRMTYSPKELKSLKKNQGL